jgi:hypothetical protein
VDIPAFFILPAGMYAGRQVMKKLYFLGLPVILLVLVFAGCSHGSNDYDEFTGTWVSGDGVWRLEVANGSWTQSKSGKELIQGTYTVAGDKIIIKYVRVNTLLFNGADAWFYYAALTDTNKNYLGGSETFEIPNDGTDTFTANGVVFTKQ